MRQIVALVAAALLSALGAVVLGEYPLQGTTALVGFPLFGVAVAELGLAVGRRLAPATLVAVAGIVVGGLSWALWISFGHFRNGVRPPTLSWAMVGAAAFATIAWGWPGRRRLAPDAAGDNRGRVGGDGQPAARDERPAETASRGRRDGTPPPGDGAGSP